MGAQVNANVVEDQSTLFIIAQKKKSAERSKKYREKMKVNKINLKKQEKLKWEGLAGAPKVCMRIHQYELPELRRIVQLGTCPTARGSLVPTARIASHMTYLG